MEGQYAAIIHQKIVDAQAWDPPRLTRREIWLPAVPNKATAVVGMRRAGKTSFLWQILSDRLAAGMPRQGLLYFSFEDERLANLNLQDLDLLVQGYYRLNPDWRDALRACWFLDEIQLVPDWERFARRILDSENIELYLSGSSARMLSREVATSMRGRALEAVVTPFSFREALRHAGREPTGDAGRLTKADRSRLDHDLLDFLAVGGFPEAQGLDQRNRITLLRGYVDLVLLRDVVERHNLSQPQVLRWLVQQLLGNSGGTFSINKFHADLKSRGVSVAKDTLHQMLAHLEDAFLLHSIGIASDSVRRRQVNPRKVYPVDTGLAALFERSAKPNSGHSLETVVFHQLRRQGAELAYVRTVEGAEVDFLVTWPDGTRQLIQVCADLTDPETQARELRALRQAAATWPEAELLLIALAAPPGLAVPEGVTLHLAAEWLLSPSPP